MYLRTSHRISVNHLPTTIYNKFDIKNRATGIVFPFSSRKVFRVYDASYSEKLVYKELSQYRIRNDREFFLLSYSKACEMIEKILIDNNMMYYKYDNKEK